MNRTAHAKFLCLLLLCGLLVVVGPSCTVGPNYERPGQSLPTTFKSGATTQTVGVLSRDWWKLFNEEELNQLEEAAMRENTDIRAAAARVTQARAAAKATFAGLLPTLEFDPSFTRTRAPVNTSSLRSATNLDATGGSTATVSSSRTSRTTNNIRIPLDLSYEVDVFGRIRRGYEASVADVRSSENDYQVVLQTLQSDVATTYFSIRGFDLQEQILQRTVESYSKQVELTKKQAQAGIVGQAAVAQAEAELNSTTTRLIDIRRQRADTEHALAILLGRTPAELGVSIRPLDTTPPTVPAGMPGDLLRRRPDVAVAEQNLISANANVGVAVASFYPRITLSATGGFESFDVRHALDWQNRLWSLGAGLTVPIFEGGRLDANLEQAQARYDEQLANYRAAVIGAVRDVEDSLIDLRLRGEAGEAQRKAVEASREYVRLANLQLGQGLISYLQLIDAQRTLLSNELSAAQLLTQRLNSTVLLMKAVGGGWEDPYSQSAHAGQPMPQ